MEFKGFKQFRISEMVKLMELMESNSSDINDLKNISNELDTDDVKESKKVYNDLIVMLKDKPYKEAVDFIVGKQALSVGNKENLERLYHELLNKDWFMTLLDLEDYIQTKDRMLKDYEDRAKWKKMMLVNIAKAGFFSSDRTIEQYNRDIWKLN